MVMFGKNYQESHSIHLTWRCTLGNCPYCWVTRAIRSDPKYYHREEHAPEEWMTFFRSLKPAILDFVGGEPTLYRGFVDIIKSLKGRHLYAPTSNLTGDGFLEFVEKCDPSYCLQVTASYHPTGRLSLREFLGRFNLLEGRKFPCSINLVVYPPLLKQILEAYDYFKGEGVRTIHLSPYEPFENVLKPYGGLAECNCGNTRLIVLPNGDVCRCISWCKHIGRRGENHLGNVFDGTFKPHGKPVLCDMYCEPLLEYDPTDGITLRTYAKILKIPKEYEYRLKRRVITREDLLKLIQNPELQIKCMEGHECTTLLDLET